jgi:hypothetical protein
LVFVIPAALAFVAATAGGQCKVPSSSNEGKLLTYYSVPIVFSPAMAPAPTKPGSIRLAFEAEYLPKPNPAIEKTGKCFQQKSEHTSLSPVFGRPRLTVGLPAGLAFEFSYLPPVKIANAKPNLASFALSEIHHYSMMPGAGGVNLMLRAHATAGFVRGPITCPRSELQTTSKGAACFGTSPSNDTFRPDMFGGEVVAAIAPPMRSFGVYGGIGANRFDPHFQVNFTNGEGGVDRTKVQLDSPVTRVSLIGGISAYLRPSIDVGAQIYSVPQDLTTFRVHAGITFR